jgi:hypothetical protein
MLNLFTVDAMEALIKYCTNSFLKLINSFDRKLINFLLLLNEPIRFRFRNDWPIGNAQEVKRNLNSYELINLRKWIHAIFYQHFHCIDSNTIIPINVLAPALHIWQLSQSGADPAPELTDAYIRPRICRGVRGYPPPVNFEI